MMRLLILLFLFGAIYCDDYENNCNSNPYVENAGPLVRTSSGSLVGKYIKGSGSDNDVAAFLGIPYAHPPVNEKRFMRPCPLDHWEGILNATVKPKPCMQYSSRNSTLFQWIPEATPSEDCLYLNIWTPAKCCCSSAERLPVLVWIFGGGFYSGSTGIDIYDGSIIASQNKAIVVSINYRVGIFGFLNIGTEEAPGNAGLLDQNLALKWIKTNIGQFGGDPNSITIVGESAGAWSVSLHMVSPMSRGLFNAAILQSGASYHPQLVDKKEIAYVKAVTYAKVIGCITDNSSIETDPGIMKCINGKSSWELAKAEDIFTSKVPQYFLPSYENDFLPRSPLKAFSEGHIAPVDILIGDNRDEASIFLTYMVPLIFNQYSEPLLTLDAAKLVLSGLFSLVPSPTVDQIYEQYFQNVSFPGSNVIVQTLIDALGDYVFNCPAYYFAEKARNAYFYWFTHRSSKEQKAKWMGVPHFYEVPYVFGLPTQDHLTYTPEDGEFSAEIMKKWVAFAQKGHPLGDENPERWPLFAAENPTVFELNPEQEDVYIHPRAEACEFWRPFLAPDDC